MKHALLVSILSIMMPLCLLANNIHFEPNLIKAKQRAASEGKLIMIAFSAKWCLPCRVMEEHTFTDQQVVQYLNEAYIPVKVDIDDFDGYALKQEYVVNRIPTIIFLDSRGNQVLMHEQSMTATELRSEMQFYDTPDNKMVTAAPMAPTPSYTAPTAPSTPSYEYEPPSSEPPTPSNQTPYTNPSTTPTDPPVVSAPHPYRPPSTPTPPIYTPPPSSSPDPIFTNEGLYEISAVRVEMRGFSIQTNAFSEQDNMILQVEQFKKVFPNQKILVNISNDTSGKTWFKIMVGHFDTRSEADMLVQEFVQQGMKDVFLKDLSSLKQAQYSSIN